MIAGVPAQAGLRACAVPSGGRLLKRSATAIAWRVTDRDGASRAVACSRRTGRSVTLEQADFLSGFRLSRLRFNTDAVAYVASYGSVRYDEGGLTVSVVDLRGKRLRFDAYLDDRSYGADTLVTSLALTSRGAIAWRYTTTASFPTGTRGDLHDAIGVADERGARIVATGSPATLSHLRVRGANVGWTENGTPRSARLRGWPRQ